MEFRFDLNELFNQPIVEVGNTLIPPGFTGDKRALWDVQSKMSQIINAIGEASAHAQGLSKPITTADRLRNSEYKLYLLMDPTANNGKGAVTGMLKTGTKGLYVFDRNGQHYQVSPQCVLDFYIHESRQRTGLGRRLFEHMLQRQQIEPEKMAIDRPSDKFLGFLSKHYGLHAPVKQMNNYVVYDGFFPKTHETPAHVDVDKSHPVSQKQSANGLQQGSHLPSQTYGRYGAAHRPCSMGQIIHNDSAVVHRNKEPTGHAYQTSQSLPNVPLNYPSSVYNACGQAAAGDYDRTLARTKEPLIPQAFDGSLRKGAHALHGSVSAPVSYYGSAPQPGFHSHQPVEVGAPPRQFTPQQTSQSATRFTQMRQQANFPGAQYYHAVPPSQMNQQNYPTQEGNQISYQPVGQNSAQSAPMENYQTFPTPEGNQPVPYQQIAEGNPQSAPTRQEANFFTPQHQQAPATSQMTQNYPTPSTQEGHPSYQAGVGSPQSATQFAPIRNEANFTTPQYQQAPPTSQVNQNYPTPPTQGHNPDSHQAAVGSPQSVTQFAPMRNDANFPTPQYQPAPPSRQMNQNYSALPAQGGDSSVSYQPMAVGNAQSATQFAPIRNEANFFTPQYQAPPSRQMNQNYSALPTQGGDSSVSYQPMAVGNAQSATQFAPMRHDANFSTPQAHMNEHHQTRPGQEANQTMQLAPQTNEQMGVLAEGNQSTAEHNSPVQGFNHNNQTPAAQPMSEKPQNLPSQTRMQESTNRVIQNYVVEGPQLSAVRDPARSQQEVDLSKGYPPQHFDEATPKADRPNSLNFEPVEEKLSELEEDQAVVDGPIEEAEEEEIQKVTVAPEMERRGSKSSEPEAAGLMTPRDISTPGLTDQGYIDLKFYHNRLW